MSDDNLIMEIKQVYRLPKGTYFVGRLNKDVEVGQKVIINDKTHVIFNIEMYGKVVTRAHTCDACGLFFAGKKDFLDVKEGDFIYVSPAAEATTATNAIGPTT